MNNPDLSGQGLRQPWAAEPASGMMLVISAPSGTGKSTLIRRLTAEFKGFEEIKKFVAEWEARNTQQF